MDIEIRKQNLIQWLMNIKNPRVIKHLERIKKEAEQSKDWREELSTKQQESVEISLKQIEDGQYISHEEAMSGIRKQYNV